MAGMGVLSHYSLPSFRNTKVPLVDVRSPGEFAQGHWPGAINLPLFSDEERKIIGTIYKQQGQKQAILKGIEFTNSSIEQFANRLKTLTSTPDNLSNKNPSKCIRIYCWRGGMRSTSIAWLAELINIQPILLQGGYKSYRSWVQKTFEKSWPLRLLGGRTGTGKTDLLLELSKKGVPVIDLEGLANHRGSSFGGLGLPPQPSTEHYENKLAEVLDTFDTNFHKEIWLEAESTNLGRCRIPHSFFKQMQSAPVMEVNRSINERLAQLINVYSCQDKELLKEATQKITKRLGPQRTKIALQAIDDSKWEEACLAIIDYYDRCYDHELKKAPLRKKIDLTGQSLMKSTETLLHSSLLNCTKESQDG